MTTFQAGLRPVWGGFSFFAFAWKTPIMSESFDTKSLDKMAHKHLNRSRWWQNNHNTFKLMKSRFGEEAAIEALIKASLAYAYIYPEFHKEREMALRLFNEHRFHLSSFIINLRVPDPKDSNP